MQNRLYSALLIILLSNLETHAQGQRREGWTSFVASHDSRIVYVSSTLGNDSNSGLSPSSPKRTIAAGYLSLRHGYPDWLLLKTGEVFPTPTNGLHLIKSGRSASEPQLIGSYGSGARPIILSRDEPAFYRSPGGGSPDRIDFIAMVGLELFPESYLGTTQAQGIAFNGLGRDILIEDCYVHGFQVNILIQSGSYTDFIQNFTIRRSIIADAFSNEDPLAAPPNGNGHAQGIFASGTNGLFIEENLIDSNGFNLSIPGARPNIFNHNLYITMDNRSVVLRDNIISNASSHGVQLRSGGRIENNLFIRNPLSILIGGAQNQTGSVVNNVILEGRDISLGLPRGDCVTINALGRAEVSRNICAHNQASEVNRAAFTIGAGSELAGARLSNVRVEENLSYNWGPIRVAPEYGNDISGIEFIRNKIQFSSDIEAHPVVSIEWLNPFILNYQLVPEILKFRDNRYAKPTGFSWNSNLLSFAEWIAISGESTSSQMTIKFPDPRRNLSTYISSLGFSPAYIEFLQLARNQSRLSWSDFITAKALNAYVRAGFNMSLPNEQNLSGEVK